MVDPAKESSSSVLVISCATSLSVIIDHIERALVMTLDSGLPARTQDAISNLSSDHNNSTEEISNSPTLPSVSIEARKPTGNMQLKKTGRALPRRLFAFNTDFWAWKETNVSKSRIGDTKTTATGSWDLFKNNPGSKLPETAQNDTDARILKIAFQFRESAAVLLLRPQRMIPSQTKNKPDHAATMSDVSKY